MLAEIFMLRVETATREAARDEVVSSRFVSIALPNAPPDQQARNEATNTATAARAQHPSSITSSRM